MIEANVSGQRALAAVMFTDAVAFSTLAGLNEPEAYRLLQDDFLLMRTACAEFGGKVLKSTGDGLLMIFDSAAQAVDCALRLQNEFGMRPRGSLQHRIGIHLCDVILDHDDAQGEGVNLASRLQAEAAPGGICLSQTIYDVVKNRLNAKVRPLGERRLRNILEPVRVFEIYPSSLPAPRRTAPKEPKQSAALPLALTFAGAAVLAAGFLVWHAIQNRGPARETVIFRDPPGQPVYEQPIRSESIPNEIDMSPPADRSEPEAEKPPEKSEIAPPQDESEVQPVEKLPPTPGSPDSPPTDPEAERALSEAREKFAMRYDYEGMLSWIDRQKKWSDLPKFRQARTQFVNLKDLKEKTVEGLNETTAHAPLSVRDPKAFDAPHVGVMVEGEKVTVVGPDGKKQEHRIFKLDPERMRALMAAVAEKEKDPEFTKLMREFDREYFYRSDAGRSAPPKPGEHPSQRSQAGGGPNPS